MLGHFGLLLIQSCFCEYHTFLENAILWQSVFKIFLRMSISFEKSVTGGALLLLWFRKIIKTAEAHEFQDLQTETSASYLYVYLCIHSHFKGKPLARVDSGWVNQILLKLMPKADLLFWRSFWRPAWPNKQKLQWLQICPL